MSATQFASGVVGGLRGPGLSGDDATQLETAVSLSRDWSTKTDGPVDPVNFPGLLSALANALAAQATLADITALINSVSLPSVRRTSAFAAVILGNDGFALEVMDNEGARHNTDLDAMRAVTETLPGRSNRATSAFDSVTIGSDGFAVDVVAPATFDPGAGPAILLAWVLALIYGQSVFTGASTAPISTVAAPGGGIKMFNGGVGGIGFDFTNNANFTSLVDAVEAGQESAARGIAEAFLQFWDAGTGLDFVATGHQLVTVLGAEGGQSALQLSDTGPYFSRLITSIDKLAALALAAGATVSVIPLVYCQGEQDMVLFSDPGWRHKLIEEHIRQPLEAHARSVFGYPVKLVVLLTQESSHQYYGVTEPRIAESDLALCAADPDHYQLVGPMYQFDYGVGGVGSHLKDGPNVKHAASYAGRALAETVRGKHVQSIKPLKAWRQGTRTIVLEYDVPVAPLVMDTAWITDPGNGGFTITKVSDGTAVAITGAAVVGDRFVSLTFNADLPAQLLSVHYAWAGGATGANAGRTTGSRGCLRDSSPDTVTISAVVKHLYNWMPIHSFKV